MTPLKQRIFEIVRRAGPDGIAGDVLFDLVYDGRTPRYRGGHHGRDESRARATLNANIYQLNQQLDGHRIVGERCAGGRYRLVRTRAKQVRRHGQQCDPELPFTERRHG
jgi:hypothetical protein